MKNKMENLEQELKDFLKYIMDVHTDRYGNLEVCTEGDEHDPTIERVVKSYLETKNK